MAQYPWSNLKLKGIRPKEERIPAGRNDKQISAEFSSAAPKGCFRLPAEGSFFTPISFRDQRQSAQFDGWQSGWRCGCRVRWFGPPQIAMLVFIFAIFYFLLIMPQQRRKKWKAMLSAQEATRSPPAAVCGRTIISLKMVRSLRVPPGQSEPEVSRGSVVSGDDSGRRKVG